MDFEGSLHSRGERLIAPLRPLAGFGLLLAAWLDPKASNASALPALLAVYTPYALLLAALFWAYDQIELRGRQQRLGREMLRVAAWPRSLPPDADALLARLLEQAAGILGAPRVLLAWEEVDEPWIHLAHRADGAITRWREAPPGPPLVAPPLAAASFLSDGGAATWLATERGIERWHGAPVGEELRHRFAIERVASWPVRGETVQGRLFALDRKDLKRDHLVLGEIVAQRVATELDQFHLLYQLRTNAVTEERIRLACDLHDGMLQSLTGAALQLQVLARLLVEDPPAAREQLREVQRLIAADQRDLRFFIEELKPAPRMLAGPLDLRDRLGELAERLERLCGLAVDVRLDAVDGQLSEAFTRQLYRLLREALFNVARHAGASRAIVEVSRQGQGLRITVTDDGRGFPFRGHYDHEDLNRQKLGPVSLKERIATLGGSLAIDSFPGLTRLEVNLPTGGGAQ